MSQLRNIVKKAAVIGLCICTFSVQVSGAPWLSANGIFMMEIARNKRCNS